MKTTNEIRTAFRQVAAIWRDRADLMDRHGRDLDPLTGHTADELRDAAERLDTWPDTLTARTPRETDA